MQLTRLLTSSSLWDSISATIRSSFPASPINMHSPTSLVVEDLEGTGVPLSWGIGWEQRLGVGY